MSTSRKAYAWQDGAIWRLSVLPKSVTKRPSNVYDDQTKLVEEASARNLEIVWE